MNSPPYIDKCEGHLRRAVVGSQLIPNWEEASQRWSRIGTCQDCLNSWKCLRDSPIWAAPGFRSSWAWQAWHQDSKEWRQAKGPQETRPPRSLYCASPFSVNNWMLNQNLMYLNRKVPKLLDPWVPHPSSPHHVDHLNWVPMSLHKILLHSLDGHGSICLALSFLLFHQEI